LLNQIKPINKQIKGKTMKHKLLTTTAITAAMLMGVANVNAQTTVKGQVH
jgi:hypothetical protein